MQKKNSKILKTKMMAALVVTKSERTCPKRPSKNPFDKLGHNKNIAKTNSKKQVFCKKVLK
ncbi:hypothetical protein A3D84_05990 [Candidatus Woesebacteria bacterium RIFCSPHIGHO2_02_FULL_42_20]|uniref:Uncharacterized protein n=1 Tax=Candidatus Woesebacteria bacterium RIFCSPHIGHO2_12_FULL_41_24 TaxID=1802510 RepID=A0A1F8AVB4_9BACT|nr:MAG: hypothetical protein A2W15_00140 [Candidatus Woesebacteria bacterium RBG_16_41_13]OGM28465.1 MAG: hypothetical protein A2873_04350 [Candidatus Woesebacteria bacterium RIFCSPHIGHO2_01_FULL_42_80]OGM35359.1 MAG: hypothetical protein A3D84_05990 [Candidatus Woesebacteria bacterium RIFCSPHIGHO2_02_FULL_42_20]OGM55570.1 MAG: hypothetical protein A3E44_04885 [Candidatus Woesebacteria bacterium RIFCSPHIGHO2_12_FULL_41_24]OGM67354.1 MAG: hypothetical protein A2969_02830 [Candidatus Woesebacteri